MSIKVLNITVTSIYLVTYYLVSVNELDMLQAVIAKSFSMGALKHTFPLHATRYMKVLLTFFFLILGRACIISDINIIH